ncbi:MAG: hypothetical protein H6R01_619 [Burkholderiaceae bacterium]|nr:hypothetical protein [Burkholderiaceae bacterium]
MKKLLILLVVSIVSLSSLAPAHAARRKPKAKPKATQLENKVDALAKNQQRIIAQQDRQASAIESLQQQHQANAAVSKGKFESIPYSYP